MSGQNLLCEHEDEASTILQWRMDENSDETTILTVQSFLLALLGEKNIWGFFKGPGFLRRHMNRSPTLADVFFSTLLAVSSIKAIGFAQLWFHEILNRCGIPHVFVTEIPRVFWPAQAGFVRLLHHEDMEHLAADQSAYRHIHVENVGKLFARCLRTRSHQRINTINQWISQWNSSSFILHSSFIPWIWEDGFHRPQNRMGIAASHSLH